MNLTATQTIALAEMARQQIKVVGILTIRRSDNGQLFDDMIDGMSNEAVILEISGRPKTQADSPKPSVVDSYIAKWENEGYAALGSGVPRTDGPTGRKSQHWLVGWDQAYVAAARSLQSYITNEVE